VSVLLFRLPVFVEVRSSAHFLLSSFVDLLLEDIKAFSFEFESFKTYLCSQGHEFRVWINAGRSNRV